MRRGLTDPTGDRRAAFLAALEYDVSPLVARDVLALALPDHDLVCAACLDQGLTGHRWTNFTCEHERAEVAA